MKKLVLAVFLLSGFLAIGQVGIGNTNPQSMLDISASNTGTPANTDGLLIPRIDEFPATDPGAAQDGMMVFVTGNGTPAEGFYYWDNGTTSWVSVSGAGSDSDWFELGGTTPADAITDNIYTQGNVQIGSTVGSETSSLRVDGVIGTNFATSRAVTTGGDASTIGYGLYNQSSITDAIRFSNIYNSNQGTHNSIHYGIENRFVNTGAGTKYGLYNDFDFSAPEGAKFGVVNRFEGGDSSITGMLNESPSAWSVSGNVTGIYNSLGTGGNGTHYGVRNSLTGTGTGVKYGSFNSISSTAGGSHYGVYSTVGNLSSGYAGYFIGRSSFGNTTTNRYLMPASDGNAGEIMATDGAGQLSFIDPSTIDSSNTLDEAYDEGGAGAGRLITADNGPVFVQGSDGFGVGGTFGAGATIGTPGAGARMFFNPNTASFRAGYVNGTQWDEANLGQYSAAFNANTTAQASHSAVFGRWNVLSGTTNSWVDTEPLFVVGNGTNNANRSNAFIVEKDGRTGIGIDNPASGLHIGISTTFDLSPINTGQDGLYIIGTGDNSGNNAIGPSIGFAPPRTNRMNQRKAAISSVQTSGDEDHVGLAFYTHGSGINISDMVERMRLNHQGYLGLNNTTPDATLDVVGSMQFVDGNESLGYVLRSDASGNASWVDPNTLITDTDDQQIDVFSLTGTTLNLSLQDDGQPTQIVDLSSLGDDGDWTVSGGNVLRNTGNVLINSVDNGYHLSVDGVDNFGDDSAINIGPNTIGGDAMQIDRDYDQAGYGLSIRQNSTYTLSNKGAIYTFNDLGDYETRINYTTNPFAAYGIHVSAPSGTTNGHGGYFEMIGSGGGTQYGVRSVMSINSGAGSTFYGYKGELSGTGASTKYGSHVQIPSSSAGIHYGYYADVQDASGYAGYFIGRTSLGTATTNRYLMPTADGSAGYIMSTNGAGQVSFVDPSTILSDDIDWYEVGGTTAPNNINDNMYTQGNVAIGSTTAAYPFNVNTSTQSRTMQLDNSSTNGGTGIRNNMSGAGVNKIGLYNDLSNTGFGSGQVMGVNNVISMTSANGTFYGMFNRYDNSTAQQGYGMVNRFANTTTFSLQSIGVDNSFAGSTNNAIGIRNSFSSTSTLANYGAYNLTQSSNTLNGNTYGVYSEFDHGGTAFTYGTYSELAGTGTGTKYGNYVRIPSFAGGQVYGLYSDVDNTTTGFAGYFLGRVSLGNTGSGDTYILPLTRGTNGQVMQTDGSGNVSWATISTSDATTASNGLTETGDDVELGGTLTQNTTVTQGSFGMIYDLTGSGDFEVRQNGNPGLFVNNAGRVGIGHNNPVYPLDIESTANTIARGINLEKTDNTSSTTYGYYLSKTTSGSGAANGIWQTLAGTGTGSTTGLNNSITNSGSGTKTGVSNGFTGTSTGIRYGINNSFLGSGNATRYGIYNLYNSGSGVFIGTHNIISTSGTGVQTGFSNNFSSSGTSDKYGIRSTFNSGTGGDIYGSSVDVNAIGISTDEKYGYQATFGTAARGTLYGLDVDVNATSAETKYGVRVTGNSSSTGTIYGIYSDQSVTNGFSGYFLGRSYFSNRVSIGETDNSTAALNVSGNSTGTFAHMEIEETGSGDGGRIRFTNSVETNNNWILYGRADDTDTESRFNIFHSGTGNIIQVRGDGRVGINDTAPTYALELPNNATVSVGQARANAWITYSDSRVKKEQRELEYGLSEVLNINPKSYEHFASDFEDGELVLKEGTGKRQIGFIAQEIYDIIPEATYKPANENEDLWSVDYEKLIPVTVNAIKELNAKVEELSEENAKLKAQLDQYASLEARLRILEGKTTTEEATATSDK